MALPVAENPYGSAPSGAAPDLGIRSLQPGPLDGAQVPRSSQQVTADRVESDRLNLMETYNRLKPEAITAYIDYFLKRTPASQQADMKALISDDIDNAPLSPEALEANFGSPMSQRVDVEALAQAVASRAGSADAQAVRDEAKDNQQAMPGHPDKPMVNIKPGEFKPEVVSQAEAEATAAKAAYLSGSAASAASPAPAPTAEEYAAGQKNGTYDPNKTLEQYLAYEAEQKAAREAAAAQEAKLDQDRAAAAAAAQPKT